MLDGILKSRSLEAFHPKKNGRHLSCKEELNPADKLWFAGTVELLAGHDCLAFEINPLL